MRRNVTEMMSKRKIQSDAEDADKILTISSAEFPERSYIVRRHARNSIMLACETFPGWLDWKPE